MNLYDLLLTDWETLCHTSDYLLEKWVKTTDQQVRIKTIADHKLVNKVIKMTFPALHEMN